MDAAPGRNTKDWPPPSGGGIVMFGPQWLNALYVPAQLPAKEEASIGGHADYPGCCRKQPGRNAPALELNPCPGPAAAAAANAGPPENDVAVPQPAGVHAPM